MVRIAHISDSHLGSSLFQLIERREDARICLKKAIEMALRKSPDILVHTGDVFHSPTPHPEDTNFVVNLLKGISETKVIVLHGNHDVPYGYRYMHSPIWMLENAGFLVSTGEKDHNVLRHEVDGKVIDIHLVSWTRPLTFRKYIRDFSPSSDAAVLFSHFLPIDHDEIPSHYDYVGHGHSHNFRLDEDSSIGCPGATCIVDWKKEIGGKSKLIVVDIDNEGVEFETETLNDVREFKFHPGLDISGMGASDANDAIKDWLAKLSPKKKGKPIIIMNVNGLVTPETENGINRGELIDFGESTLNPLFLHIEPNWQVVGPPEVTLSEPLNIELSLEEYLKQSMKVDSEQVLGELKKIKGGK
ncbi:MAG: exonuclease SbcCD subunit D [Candidatus Thorarchaeota archaeon]